MVTQAISALICIFVVEDMAKDTITQIKVPGVAQFSPSVHKSKKKKHFGHSFAFDAPTLWNDLPDDVCFAPNLACFRKKLKSYLFDKISLLHHVNK